MSNRRMEDGGARGPVWAGKPRNQRQRWSFSAHSQRVNTPQRGRFEGRGEGMHRGEILQRKPSSSICTASGKQNKPRRREDEEGFFCFMTTSRRGTYPYVQFVTRTLCWSAGRWKRPHIKGITSKRWKIRLLMVVIAVFFSSCNFRLFGNCTKFPLTAFFF